MDFRIKTKPKDLEKKKEKNIQKNLYALFDGRERVLDAFESKEFPIKKRCRFFRLSYARQGL